MDLEEAPKEVKEINDKLYSIFKLVEGLDPDKRREIFKYTTANLIFADCRLTDEAKFFPGFKLGNPSIHLGVEVQTFIEGKMKEMLNVHLWDELKERTNKDVDT